MKTMVMNKINLFFLAVFSCGIPFVNASENYSLWIRPDPELGIVVHRFLRNNDTLAYRDIETAKDRYGLYCFYESEYFMYSLVQALDYGNTYAFSELNRLLHKFYDVNLLEEGDFVNDLSAYFQSHGNVFFADEKNLGYRKVTSEAIVYKSKEFTNPAPSYMDSLLKVTNEGDTLAYSSLLNYLHSKCLLETQYNFDRFFYNRMVFFSIYNVDKNHSAQGYRDLFILIMRFYRLTGTQLSTNSSRLALYFLKKAAKLGNEKAKDDILKLIQCQQ